MSLDAILTQGEELIPSDSLGQIVNRVNGKLETRGVSKEPKLVRKGSDSEATFTSNFWETTQQRGVDVNVKFHYLLNDHRTIISLRSNEEKSGKTVSFTGIDFVHFAPEYADPPAKGSGIYVSSVRRSAMAMVKFTYEFSSQSKAREFRGKYEGNAEWYFFGIEEVNSSFDVAKRIDTQVRFSLDVTSVGGDHTIKRSEFFDDNNFELFNPVKALKVLDDWKESITNDIEPESLQITSFSVTGFSNDDVSDSERGQPKVEEKRACYDRLYAILGLLAADDLGLTDDEMDSLENELDKLNIYISAGLPEGEDLKLRRDAFRDFPLRRPFAELPLFWLGSNSGRSLERFDFKEIGWGFNGSAGRQGSAPGLIHFWKGTGWISPNLEWASTWAVIDRIEVLVGDEVIETLISPTEFHALNISRIYPLSFETNDPPAGERAAGFRHFPEGQDQVYGFVAGKLRKNLQDKLEQIKVVAHYVDGSSAELEVK